MLDGAQRDQVNRPAGTDVRQNGNNDAQRDELAGDRRAGESPPAGVRLSDGLGGTAIDLAAVANLDDLNCARGIIDGVYDAKLTLTNAISPLNAS
jgi:hypothetical protein